MDEEKVCCMCNEKKKFLARINAGKKYYCMECEAKINKSGMDYWKSCSFVEFLENVPSSRTKRNSRTSNMLTGLKEQLRQIDEEESKNNHEK